MPAAFTGTNFVIKRKGISTSKFQVCSPSGATVFYVEEKIHWKPPFETTIEFFSDEKRTQAVLQARDGHSETYTNFLDVFDAATGERVGGLGGDWTNWFEDAWAVVDAGGRLLCNVRESGSGRAILHELTGGILPQKFHFLVGDDCAGELRQKPVLIGSQLLVDFSADTAGRLAHRLGLVAAVMVAAHQATTDED